MKITLCGSTAFILEMEAVAKQLEKLGYEVQFPPVTFTDGDGKEWHWLIPVQGPACPNGDVDDSDRLECQARMAVEAEAEAAAAACVGDFRQELPPV